MKTKDENKTIFENQNQRWKYYRRSKVSQQFSTTVENLIALKPTATYVTEQNIETALEVGLEL